MSKVLVAGLCVEASPTRLHDAAIVTVHKLGSDMRAFLTPIEARKLADELLHAASVADGTAKP